jgi:hypothetical protein
MAFVNAIVDTPEETEVRVSLRLEFLSAGLDDVIPHWREMNDPDLNNHLQAFEEDSAADLEEVLPKQIDHDKINLGNVDSVFSAIKSVASEPEDNIWSVTGIESILFEVIGFRKRCSSCCSSLRQILDEGKLEMLAGPIM